MKFPILFKRTNTSAIQQWRIWTEINTKGKDKIVSIVTEYGQKDSDNLQFTTEIIKEGKNIGKKNETSIEQQADKEAKANWDKKKKNGYFENIKQIDKQTFFQPMLAKKFDEFKTKISYPVILDRKYNGGRLIAKKDGLFSRKGELFLSIPHIFEVLKPLFDKYPDLILDGEVYNHEYRYKLNEIMHLIRKSKNISKQDLIDSEAKIKYYVYDGLGFDGVTNTTRLVERRKAIKKHFSNIKYIEIVTGQTVDTEKELYKYYEDFLEDGYEGGIVRNIDSPYENKRSKYLLKLKPEDDSEATILDINEGVGNWAGTGKKITLEWQGQKFDASFKGSIEQGREFLKNKKQWIGKEVTFLYNGLTGLGTPNFARIDINNCLK